MVPQYGPIRTYYVKVLSVLGRTLLTDSRLDQVFRIARVTVIPPVFGRSVLSEHPKISPWSSKNREKYTAYLVL